MENKIRRFAAVAGYYMLMSAQPLPYYTHEQYVEMEEHATYKSEFISGRIHAMSGGTPKHSLIAANIILEIGSKLKGGRCKVYSSDLRVGIMPLDVETYPDITVVCGEPRINPFDKNSIINPAVIFEVLSPSAECYDRGEKWARYQRLDSLQQYVLVSQETPRVEHYTRLEDGTWNYAAVEGIEPASVLQVQGMTLSLAEIYDKNTFEEREAERDNPDSDGGKYATM